MRRGRVIVSGVSTGKDDGLVRTQASGSVHRVGVTAAELHIGAGANDKEHGRLGQRIEPLEMNVAAVHDRDSSRLQRQLVEQADIAGACSGDINIGRDAAAQVEQRVHLDRRFGTLVGSPGEQSQAEVDDCGVEGKDGFLQREAELLARVERARLGDEDLGKLRVDSPVALFIGVGQCIATDARTAESHVVQPGLHGTQAGLDVAEALAVGQLGECQGEELVHAGEALDFALAGIARDTAMKRLQREQSHDLGEDSAAGIHAPNCHTSTTPFKSFPLSKRGKQLKSRH